jgi:hypothetical protein
MAEYGIVVGFEKIKGNIQIPDYKEWIGCDSVTFSSYAQKVHVGGVSDKNARKSVTQSNVNLVIGTSKWAAELQQALYNTTPLGKVQIVQLAQAVDKNSTAAPTVIQKVTLTDAYIVDAAASWAYNVFHRSMSLTLNFAKILFEIGSKPADFTLRNITEGAK